MQVVGGKLRVLAGSIVVLAICAAVADGAVAKIVIGQGIAGVNIGDTEAQVQHIVGRPTTTYKPARGVAGWQYTHGPLSEVEFDKGRVFYVLTGRTDQKTSKGIGVGSSVAAVRRAYPSARCTSGSTYVFCDIKTHSHGKIVTTRFSTDTATGPISSVLVVVRP